MKSKRLVSILLSLMMIVSCVVVRAVAMDSQPVNAEENETITQSTQLSEASIACYAEITQSTMNAVEAQASFAEILKKQPDLNSFSLNRVEQIFDCNLSISSAEIMLDQRTDQVYTRYTCEDKTELSFDEDGNLFKISTIFGETPTNGNDNTKRIQSAIISGWEAKEQCIKSMPEIQTLFDIGCDYSLTSVYDFDDEYVFYTFEKLLENGVYNPYQAVKVVYNKKRGKFSIARKFEATPNELTPRIGEREAIKTAEEMVNHNVRFSQAQLTYINQRFFNSKAVFEKYDPSVCYLVFRVSSIDDNLILYVDALTGECIGSDITKEERGRAYAIEESVTEGTYNYNAGISAERLSKYNSWQYAQALVASITMRKLGYNSKYSVKADKTLITDIKDFLKNDSKAYAFYFAGHANQSVLGFSRNGWVTPSDVTGNWHFVFLDGCKTAEGTAWANAFKINGYSNRGFLGWSKGIGYLESFEFSSHFWKRLNGTNTIRQVAIDAAGEVDGSTPIRYYGDRSYTGTAWS